MNRHESHLLRPSDSAWKHQVSTLRHQANSWWVKHTPRERRLLGIVAIVIAVTLLWSIVLKPALDSIALSNERLPRLRADAARVDALILETQALQRRQSGHIDATELPQALRASLQRAGLETAEVHDVADTTSPAAAWEVSLHDASASRVMEWLAGVPQLLHLRIITVELTRSRIDGRDRPGQVSGSVRVQMAKGATP